MTATLSNNAHEIVNRIDLPRFLSDHQVPVVMKGSRPWASCWVHQDSNPSVQLNDPSRSTKGRWTVYCHGCNDCRGDALDVARQLKGLSTQDAITYLEKYLGHQGSAPVSSSPLGVHQAIPKPGISREDQVRAAEAWGALIDRLVPHAGADAEAYLVSRGASKESIAEVGGGRLVRRLDWFRINHHLAKSPDLALLREAHFVVEGSNGQLRSTWFDDVVLCASRMRSGEPSYIWGRRLDPSRFAPDMKYQNQRGENGVRHMAFGLDAVVRAAATKSVVRAVEGPITALGSRSLRDGQAAPTFAVLHRLGWIRPDQRQENEWCMILDYLRQCSMVEICPDNDEKQKKLDQGVVLGANLVTWLRCQGVKSELRLFQPYAGEVDRSLLGRPLGYPQKDFSDVSLAQASLR